MFDYEQMYAGGAADVGFNLLLCFYPPLMIGMGAILIYEHQKIDRLSVIKVLSMTLRFNG